MKTKPCKVCGVLGHSATFCFARKRKPAKGAVKPIRRIGKYGDKWLRFRAQWFKDNPQEYYTCYLCGDTLTPRETTLDHVIPRSRRPDLRYEASNIKPCCYRCNMEKGSKVLD